MKQNAKRALERATTNIFSRVHEDDDCCRCCSDSDDDGNEIEEDEEEDVPPSSTSPTIIPTASPSYSEKKILASDGGGGNFFGDSYDYDGAVYLFKLDGTEVMKLDAGEDLVDDDRFGYSLSIDEKIVVGTLWENYARVFSGDGTYERTLTCEDCTKFGKAVATYGNKIVIKENQKFFIFTTEGGLLKEEDFGDAVSIEDVAISNEVVVWTATGSGKTVVYSNIEPDFAMIAEIEQEGTSVEVSGDKLVIGNEDANDNGAAWIYKTDGTLVKELEHDATASSNFGKSVGITDDKVLVSAPSDDVGGENTGSVFIYSAIDGEFIEKVLASDGEDYDFFGASVCSDGSYYMVGAPGNTAVHIGEAYLFNLPS